MPPSAIFNVDAFLDKQKISLTHIRIIALLFAALVLDGYDILVVGAVLPPIARSMHVHPQALTGVFVAQQIGLLVGTLFAGPLADRFGRRTVLLSCIGLATIATLSTTQATTPNAFLIIRFISAIFFSAIIPNCIAMSSEVAPGRIKAGIVAIVFGGYSGGNFINAFVQAFVLDAYGWQGAFWMGGVLGIVLFVVLLVFLPESIRFRAGRNSADPEIGRALCKFDPTLRFSGEERFVLDEVKKKKQHAPVVSLFKDGLLVPTLLLWLTYIAVFTVSHLSGAWNTTVLHNMAGLSFKYLASMTALATIAGIFGTMTSGFVIDRFGPVRAMPFFFIGAAIFHAAFGLINLNSAMFYVVGVLSSYFSNSGLGSVNVLGAILYSSRIRATGVSWATGAGRFGGMLGPIIGGGMLAAQWNITTIYLVVGTPLFIAAFAIIAMGWSAPALRKGRVANEKDALAEPLVSKTTGALNS